MCVCVCVCVSETESGGKVSVCLREGERKRREIKLFNEKRS